MTLKKQVVKKEWYNNVGVNTPRMEKTNGKWVKKNLKKIFKKQEISYEKKREIVEKAEQQLTGAQ